MEFGTGCLFDEKISAKNYKFSELMKAMTKNVTAAQTYPIKFWKKPKSEITIYNQWQTSKCSAFSLANARKDTEMLQNNTNEHFNVDMIYSNRDVNDWQGEGMYPEQSKAQLIKFGTCKATDWQPNKSTYAELKPLFDIEKNRLLPLASPYKISSFYEIDKNSMSIDTFINEIKFALMNNFEVTISINLYTSFDNAWNNGGVIPSADYATETLRGGHEMYVVGWNEFDQLIVANSWGATGGDNGFCYIPFTANIIRKLYVCIDSITEKETKGLKFVNILDNTKSSDKNLTLIKINIMKMGNWYSPHTSTLQLLEYDNNYYIQIGSIYNTRADAKVFKDTSGYKESMTIMPINTPDYYILYVNIEFSEQQVNDFIAGKVFGERNYINYKKNDKFYLGIKYETNTEAITGKNDIVQNYGFDVNYLSIDVVA